jgi:acetyl-CoA C-acetyltransferase/acetyl-CoA acyltransferase
MANEARPSRVVILSGLRSAQARAGGAFAKENAAHLGAAVSRELIARTGVKPGEIDEVIAGCVGPPFDQANVARVLALRAGLPHHVPAFTVGRNCASGMEAIAQAATKIEAGQGSLYLCVGVEVMSSYPLAFGREMTALFERLSRARTLGARLAALASFRLRFLKPRITLVEGLTDPIADLIMGRTAEVLAREWNVTREDSDRFALESHQRAARARDSGRFAREILPVVPLGAPDGSSAVANDDGIRDGQTLEALAKLKPYFEKPDGVVTVGNSCGITDGATALIVTTEERARALGQKPLARIASWAFAALDPKRMGLGPVYSTAKALERAGLSLADVGPIEINEAFAAQVLACAKAFASKSFGENELGRGMALGELDFARTNRNGGAIALGHPVGASGARLPLTVAHEMQVMNHQFGLATLCVGGGQGGAMVLERSK